MTRRLVVFLAFALAAVSAGSAVGAVRDPRAVGGQQQLVDLTVRPSGADLARIPGSPGGYAIVYDDRLGSNALRYGERSGGGWRTRVIVSESDVGQPVGNEPQLAISRTGLRVVTFRTHLGFHLGKADHGSLYVSRSADGVTWSTDKLDDNGFGAAISFGVDGKPAVAYLQRTGASRQARVRLARLRDGKWAAQTVAMTQFRDAASDANASSVGLALSRRGRFWVAYIDLATHSLRIASPVSGVVRLGRVPENAARAVIGFAPTGDVGIAVSSLAGEPNGVRVFSGRLGERLRRSGALGRSATAPAIIGFAHRMPIVAFRDRIGANVALPRRGSYRVVTVAVSPRYSKNSKFNGAFGAALAPNGGIAATLVGNSALLVFAAATIQQ